MIDLNAAVPKAERMLAELGIEMARERDAYYDDVEYAASLLDVTYEQLQADPDDESSL